MMIVHKSGREPLKKKGFMMKLEKKMFTYVLTALCAALILAVVPVSGEEALYDNVLRLHVIANSDSDEDQALKLAVRDEILSVYGDRLAECTSKKEAEEKASLLADEMQKTAESLIAANGYDYGVRLTLSRESYPTRVYENVTMPAGEYCSLRIVIGEGAGENWWCVLFPPMCVSNAIGEKTDNSIPVGLSASQYKLISGNGRYAVRFKILEVVEDIFH